MADGEPAGMEQRLVEAHVARCVSCRRYRSALALDRTPATLRSRHAGRLALAAERVARWHTTRVLLAVVAIQLLILSGRDLLWPAADGRAVHDVRHLAAFTLAYGMMLIAVAVRPARSAAALPAAAVLAGALAITAVVDLSAGRVPLVGEAMHIPEVLSVVLIAVLAPPTRPRGVLRRLPRRVRPVGERRRAG